MLTRPFAHLNLRRNPFGEPEPSERASLAVLEDFGPLGPGEAVQFIGESGRGKTTRLLRLAALHPGAVYDRLDEGQDRSRVRVPSGAVYLLDEAQRMRPALLARLLARADRVALGTHEDLAAVAGRPLRTVHVGGPPSVELLDAIVRRRVEWARRGPGPVPEVGRATLADLIARHGDDLRAIEGDLYDLFQSREELLHGEL